MKICIVDFHVGTQMWQASVLRKLGHSVDIYSLAGHSKYLGGNFKQSKLLNDIVDIYGGFNGFVDDKKRNRIKQLVSKTKEFKDYDIFVVSFPPCFWELARLLNKTAVIIVNCAHNFNMFRSEKTQYINYVKHIKQEIETNRIFFTAMSIYAAEYIHYYMGFKPLILDPVYPYLDGVCKYDKQNNRVLIGPAHVEKLHTLNMERLNNLSKEKADEKGVSDIFNFSAIRQDYHEYTFKQLAKHPAIVAMPYSAFSISMSELYSLSIPIFAPSLDYTIDHDMLYDRSLVPLYEKSDLLYDEPYEQNNGTEPSPNKNDLDSKKYWYKRSFLFNKPHIIYWDDENDLIDKLYSADLEKVHISMRDFNNENNRRELEKWERLLADIQI
ncbi:MAG: hypothetical protein PHG69_04760 [Candidatus Omnitrophica bacterium]|nr:hypothetical protein [Candidatus Omnitrophota bacterium]